MANRMLIGKMKMLTVQRVPRMIKNLHCMFPYITGHIRAASVYYEAMRL